MVKKNYWASGIRLRRFRVSSLILRAFLISNFIFQFSSFCYADANPIWGQSNVLRRLAVQSGGGMPTVSGNNTSTDVAVWSDRANVTNGTVDMTAAGDGTYEYNIRLAQGSTYNFLLFTRTNATPPAGMNANADYYDTVASDTNSIIITSATPSNPTEPGTEIARFKPVGKGFDARRVLTVPRSLAAGSTLWVLCNFASTPTAPINFQAQPSSATAVDLSWGKPYGNWGTGGDSFAAADVIAGGIYRIRHSTGAASGPYEDLVTLPGTTFTYTNAGLTSGQTYYYIIMSSDAYRGSFGSKNIENSYSAFSSTNTAAYGSPQGTRRVRFKVENIDWEKAEGKFQSVVWMTPWDEDGKNYPFKEPGRIVRVYVPPPDAVEEKKQKAESKEQKKENGE